ncbi:MAG: OmpA family protein [Alphaproteobacteria bacterium]
MRNRERTCLRALVRFRALVVLAGSVAACSTVSGATDWVNPWSGSSEISSADPETAAPSDAGEYPSVASVPERPTPVSTPEERSEISSGLIADRAQAQYSADVLRGGTEPAAPPPPPAPPRDLAAIQPSLQTPAGDENEEVEDDSGAGDNTSESLASPTEDAPQPAPQPQLQQQQQQQVASFTPAAPQPATPVVRSPNTVPGAQPAIPADAPLAFQPSKAPPLDRSVTQFVPAEVVARYEATQAAAASDAGGGSVHVNPDAIGSRGLARASADGGAMQTAVYQTGRTPVAVASFPKGGYALDSAANAQVAAAANAFKASGSSGIVRVIGHTSSRTPDMSLAEHIAYVFKQSQDRANAVAAALVRAGVPATSVVVEAVGDTQPIYYESMPKGEEGNRRVEIFIEG